MNQYKILILDTIKREYKNNFLYFLTFLSLLILLALNYGTELFLQNFKSSFPLLDIGPKTLEIYFYFINSWSFVLSIVLGSQVVKVDINTRIIGQILSFNIGRTKYIISRIVGVWFLVFLYYLVFFLVAISTVSIHTQSFSFHSGLLFAFLLSTFLNLFVIIMSTFLSLYLNRIATTLTMFLFIAVINLSNMAFFSQSFKLFEANFVSQFFYILFPHLGLISKLVNDLIFNSNIQNFPSIDLFHFVLISLMWLYFLCATFKKRDI